MDAQPLYALLVDGSAPVRTSLRGILQGLGIHDIDIAPTLSDGRRKMLSRKYDVVLCEYHFDGEETGQDLLEQVTEHRMLPPPTIFIMVTTEASYPRVMSVAEITPDEYVLKPVQSGQLADRIERAFKRREALGDIHQAIYDRRYSKALKIAEAMMAGKSTYSSDVAKLVAQILCKLERYNEAAVFYRHIAKSKNLAWAKFGLSKMSLLHGDKATAENMLLDVINQHLNYLPVYDYLTEFYLHEGRQLDALGITEKALEISPHGIRRLQLAGQLAFGVGDRSKANTYFNRVVALRGSTVELSLRSMLQLALICFSTDQAPQGESLVKQMQAKLAGMAGEPDEIVARAKQYCQLASAADAISTQPLAAMDRMRELASHWDRPEFDLDFVHDFLAVLAALYNSDNAAVLLRWTQPVILRVLGNDAIRDTLRIPVANCPQLAELVDTIAETISLRVAEVEALEQSEGVAVAAKRLCEEAGRSLNTRLLLLAATLAGRCYQQDGDETMRDRAENCLAKLPPDSDTLPIRQLLMPTAKPVAASEP